MEYRNKNKIKTIGQYNVWIRLHQMELESDNENGSEEDKYEEYNNNHEDEQLYTSR